MANGRICKTCCGIIIKRIYVFGSILKKYNSCRGWNVPVFSVCRIKKHTLMDYGVRNVMDKYFDNRKEDDNLEHCRIVFLPWVKYSTGV